MAHYALLDENNIVVDVIVGKDENEDSIDYEEFYGNFHNKICKRTSYESYGGLHPEGMARVFRKNYAGIGYKYDEARDAFIPPQPYPSWILNEDSCLWDAPVSHREALIREYGSENVSPYRLIWNEETKNWEKENQ